MGLASAVAWHFAGLSDAPSGESEARVKRLLPAEPRATAWQAPSASSPAGLLNRAPAAQAAVAATDPGASPPGAAQAQGQVTDDVLNPEFVATALQALSAHGLPLHKPQPSLHSVQTRDLDSIQGLLRWAQSQGFRVRPALKVLEHGGEVTWVVPLERHILLEVNQILADGEAIKAQLRHVRGTRYHTWQVPMGGRSTLSAAAPS